MSLSLAELIFILVLIAAGGAIAWVGDWVGYRLGKKRVSLFGIRPRTTAIIIGSLFGALISALTIFVLAATRQEYRDALFHAEELREERDELRAERDELLGERDGLKRDVAEAKKDASDAKQAASDAQAKRAQLQESVARQEAHLGQLRSRLAARQRRLREVQGLLAGSEAANEELQKEADELEGEISDLQRLIEEGGRELETTKTQLARVNTLLIEAREKYEQYRQEVALREYGKPPPIEAGHEFVRDVVDLTQSAPEVRDKITELLERASAEALDMGAEVGENGRAVRLYAVKAETEVPTLEPEVPEPQALEAVVESLMNLEEKSQVVGVTALFPAWEGQQVLVGLPHRWNKLVFSEGEVAASEVIDGSQTRADLYRALSLLLIGSVRPEAESRDMLYLPNTREIGRVSVDEMFDAIEELKRHNRPMEVQAVVERDTWTIGPLNLDLRIIPPAEE